MPIGNHLYKRTEFWRTRDLTPEESKDSILAMQAVDNNKKGAELFRYHCQTPGCMVRTITIDFQADAAIMIRQPSGLIVGQSDEYHKRTKIRCPLCRKRMAYDFALVYDIMLPVCTKVN